MMDLVGCVHGTNLIRTRSGKYLDLANPNPADIDLLDIAGALSKICRFGSQIDFHYSVSEHCCNCLLVARQDRCSIECQRSVLMHDAAEAFCGDIVRPLKKMLPEYSVIEKRMMRAIAERFEIDFDFDQDVIHEIDNAVVIAERNQVFRIKDDVEWFGEKTCRKLEIDCYGWTAELAELMFLMDADELGIH